MRDAAGIRKLNIVSTLANQLMATVCGIVVPRVLLSAFGSEAYGITVSITQFLSYITLLESGIGGVARGRLYGPLARGDMAEVSGVYHAVKRFFLYVAAAFVLYSLVLGLGYHDLAHVTLFSRRYIFWLVLVISLSTLAKYMGGLANLTLIVADQKQYVNNAIAIGITLTNTASILLLTQLDCGILWVKLGSSLIFVLRPLLYGHYVRRHYALPRVTGGGVVLEQKWTGLGQHIAYFLHTNTDVVLLTLFANARLVAVYSVYHLVVSSVRAITESFSGGMEAAFGRLIAQGRLRELRRLYARYQALLAAVSLTLFGCTGILIVPFVRLYTRGITDADYVQPLFAAVLVLAEAVNCLMLPCSSLPVAANRFRQTRWGAYGEALLNIGLSCLLIFWDPLLGVALGTLLATLFRGIYYLLYGARELLHLPPLRLLLPFAGLLALLGGVIVAGRLLLRGAVMDNYLQWALWGAVSFAALGLPAGAFTLLYLKKRTGVAGQELREDEEAADRQQ